VTLSPEGERSILFVNGANECFDLTTVPSAWLSNTQVVALSSVFVLPQFSGQAVGGLFAQAKIQGAITVLNISWDARGQGLSFLKPALAETDYLILSHDEGHQLTHQESPEAILAVLAEQTAGKVILTLGADGCCLHAEDGFQHIPAVSVKAADCTGAGDSFSAGFIAGVVSGYSCAESARLGCQVAAFAVTGPGAYARIPSLAEMKKLDNK
jgi:sugar/nucleoside kinase (ribokinase family)